MIDHKALGQFWSQHILLAHVAHVGGGFGAALVLQHYLVGNAFLPVWVGFALIAAAIAAHVYAITSKR